MPGPIFFIHIPKTAGTSVKAVLNAQYNSDELLLLYQDELHLAHPDEAFLARIRPRLPDTHVVFGHYYYGVHELLGSPSRYMAILRDPVQRVLSFYSHHARIPALPYYTRIQEGLTLAEFVADCVDYQVNNLMTRMIAGVRERDEIRVFSESYLEQALDNIGKSFLCIGAVESLDDMMNLLARTFAWKPYHLQRLNTAEEGVVHELDDRTRAIIEAYNRLDMELYQRFRKSVYTNASLFGEAAPR